MGFKQTEVDGLLVACHRRCCICHKFCGTKIELDHIKPRAEGGADTIDNAIPVCFECHAEIHCYNDQHPRGRKFREAELRLHKAKWLKLCHDKPQLLPLATGNENVGPLQALVDEIEFNCMIARPQSFTVYRCQMHDEQFRRAIQSGTVSLLKEDLKEAILHAYQHVGIVNNLNHQILNQPFGSKYDGLEKRADISLQNAKATLDWAKEKLLKFLAPESSDLAGGTLAQEN